MGRSTCSLGSTPQIENSIQTRVRACSSIYDVPGREGQPYLLHPYNTVLLNLFGGQIENSIMSIFMYISPISERFWTRVVESSAESQVNVIYKRV